MTDDEKLKAKWKADIARIEGTGSRYGKSRPSSFEAVKMNEPYWCKALPNVPRVWSASSLSTLAACPRRFELSYVEGWTPRGDNLDLEFGSAFHLGIRTFISASFLGESRADALDRALSEAWKIDLPLPLRPNQAGKTQLGLARAIIAYVDSYIEDPSAVLLIDGKLALEVPFSFAMQHKSPDHEHYTIRGFIDMVRDFGGVYTVVDFKTTNKEPSEFYFDRYAINFQNSIYSTAVLSLTNLPVTQFLVDAVGVLPSGIVHPRRQIIQLTTGELNEGLEDITHWIVFAELCAAQNYWPKNPDACSFCQFRTVCNKDPKTRINHLHADFVEKRKEFV
jgi:hypothetical protein